MLIETTEIILPDELWMSSLCAHRCRGSESSYEMAGVSIESIQNFAAFFVFFWLMAIILHHLFCRRFQWYQEQVDSGTIQVSFGRIYLTSHSLSASIQKIGAWPRLVKLWRIWFICGVIVSSLLILPVMIFLVYLFYGHITKIFRWYTVVRQMPVGTPMPSLSSVVSTGPSVQLTPVIPGINLPLPHALPFLISILFSTFFHELGHGISAASEFTDVDGVGVALIGIFPAAFVVVKNLDAQALQRQLRIMAAGVWHNIVLALTAALLLWLLPNMITPIYPQGKSVTVVQVLDKSAISNHTAAFKSGMEIYSINNCSVTSGKTLERCAFAYSKPGFCLSLDEMKSSRGDFLPPVAHPDVSTEAPIYECCKNASSSLCFRDDNNSSLPTPECLQVRKVLSITHPSCNSSYDCPAQHQCYIPYLAPSERLLIFNTSTGPVLFVGDPFTLVPVLKVSNFSARSLLPLWLPDVIERTLKYFVSVSAALALLNLVPSFGLDGARFAALWLDLLFRYRFLPERWAPHQQLIGTVLTVVSTVLLVADVLMGFTQI
ncbi:hypothetical protein RvY_13299 [Ramazzottius varieornatus]|uniref:Membrane-bound transcription factor site-2 protease n=1 Tax=Ramazzottius varieornatus TaxID=947166 RepID=A0A1D1VMF3_RAMVA|nr:hypothetical protein RvY_13299 [Ramazzottius varieornatus]